MPSDNFDVALHKEAPSEVGAEQTEKEADYSGYARVSLTEGHIKFPAIAEGEQRITHYSLGQNGVIHKIGEFKPSILVVAPFDIILDSADLVA